MFATALLISSSLASVQRWELSDPLSFDIGEAVNAALRARLASSKQMITQEQAGKALRDTDCSDFVTKRPMHLQGNKTCWNYDFGSVPKGCPSGGWVKYGAFHFAEAKVGKAGIAVDDDNKVGLVVSDVSFTLAPTKYTAQEHGFFTTACDGVIKGVISGAVNAVEAYINYTSNFVPVVGEGIVGPVDGVVVKLEKSLDGLCGFLEDVVEDLLDICGDLLHNVIQEDLPPIIQGLLKQILEHALNGNTGTTAKPALEFDGWTRTL